MGNISLVDYFIKEVGNISDKKIMFWGASNFLNDVLLKEKFPNVLGIVDKDVTKQNTEFGWCKIYSPDILDDIRPDIVIMSVKSNNQYIYNIVENYLKENFPNIKLYKNLFYSYYEYINVPKYYCPFCDKYEYFEDFGNPIRKYVKCPYCKSLERHRFLYYVYQKHIFNKLTERISVLHTAPEKSIYKLFNDNEQINYVSIDLDPSRYPYAKNCKKMNVLDLQFDDDKFDFIISNHVVEHIEDEKLFFMELTRVLKPDGKIILTAPYDNDLEKTFEDSSIVTPEDRLKYYGQEDHVRLYGRDINERFKKYGKVEVVNSDFISEDLCKKMNIGKSQRTAIIISKNK